MNLRLKVSAFALSILFAYGTRLRSADTPKRPHITAIARVQILSSDVPKLRDFDTRVLGVREGPCNWCERIPRRAFVAGPGQLLELSPAPSPLPSNLLSEISFATDNVDELRRYLVKQGVEVNAEGVSVVDPEGHHINFVQSPPLDVSKGLIPPATGIPGSQRIIHAGFIVRDRAATEHFYKDILGFRPYWHGGIRDDETDWVSLQVPDGTDWIEMMVNVSPDADQHVRGIMNHIAIGVTDIHATEHRLKDAGVNLTEQPKIGRDGKWQLNVYDLDQTRIEFMEFAPVQKPCCSDFTGPHPQP